MISKYKNVSFIKRNDVTLVDLALMHLFYFIKDQCI